MKLDKKGKLIINIFNYGKKHIARDNLWHKLNYKHFIMHLSVLEYLIQK